MKLSLLFEMDERLRKLEREAGASPDDPELQERLRRERIRAGVINPVLDRSRRFVTEERGQDEYYVVAFSPSGVERDFIVLFNPFEVGSESYRSWYPLDESDVNVNILIVKQIYFEHGRASLFIVGQFEEWFGDYCVRSGVNSVGVRSALGHLRRWVTWKRKSRPEMGITTFSTINMVVFRGLR